MCEEEVEGRMNIGRRMRVCELVEYIGLLERCIFKSGVGGDGCVFRRGCW